MTRYNVTNSNLPLKYRNHTHKKTTLPCPPGRVKLAVANNKGVRSCWLAAWRGRRHARAAAAH